MDASTAATFFTLVLIGSLSAVLVSISTAAGRAVIAENALTFSAAIAVGATAGSLYFSEIAGFVPCELCWFQRIAMYPLAIVLPPAAVRRDHNIVRYALPLALIGLAISLYHIQLQAFPDQGSFCELANPCSASLVSALGFVTIPIMAAMSFGLIVIFGWQSLRQHKETAHE